MLFQRGRSGQRIQDLQPRKSGEIAIVCADGRAVLNGERGKMRIHDQRVAALANVQEIGQDLPVFFPGSRNLDLVESHQGRDDLAGFHDG